MLDDYTGNWELSGLPIDSEYDAATTNSIFLAWIENLGNHIGELAAGIEAEIQHRDDFYWDFAFGPAGMDLYQLHTLTISYFEISSYLIVSDELRCAPPSDNTKRLIDAIYSRKGHVLDDSQKQRNAFKRLQSDQNLNAGFYKFVLSESGLLDNTESEVLKRVNSIRGDFVHDFFQILEIDDKDRALDLVKDCQVLLNVISDLLHEHIEYDSDIYHLVTQNNDESN
ncbi:hypothetical protein ACFQE1_03005 [Halobium palmae]|uniref:Apea-like HEPN domain-containing protein n=1 Tax=Halobium palmae TaxID=1776492 RepID=A0ABD5RWK9_9EURY